MDGKLVAGTGADWKITTRDQLVEWLRGLDWTPSLIEAEEFVSKLPFAGMLESTEPEVAAYPYAVAVAADHTEFVGKLHEVRMEPDKLIILIELERDRLARLGLV